MLLHLSSGRRAFLAVCAAAILAPPLAAQRAVPPAPANYDVELRYSIRAGTQQRIAQFQRMTQYFESVGFQRVASDDPNEAADANAERMRGTLPSDKVRDLLREPHVRTVLLMPAGMKRPEDAEQRVLVQLELESRLSPSRQRDLAIQARARLAGIGFVEKVGYDHQANVRLLGTLPAGEVETLLHDLRDLPAGWLAPDVPRDQLPEPIRDVNPIRIVEVLAEPAGVLANADVPQPIATDSTLEKLPVDLRDADPAEVLRLEVILARKPHDGDFRWRDLVARPGVTIEGRLGPVVAIRAPAGIAKELVVSADVAGVRRPAAATRQPPVPPSGKVVDALTLSGLNRLASPGIRGRGIRVAVIESDFRGAAGRIGSALSKATSIVDLTSARNADIVPDPVPAGDEIGSGTRAALAVQLAAPECELVLVRIDSAAAYMLADAARYFHGDATRPESLASRNRDLLADNEQLRIVRRQVNDEQAALVNDFNQDDATIERRKKLVEKIADLVAKEKQYLDRLTRFTQLEEDLLNLRKVNVVVNGLAWDTGYPVDGTGALSRYLDEGLFAPQSRGPAYWFQAAGDTRRQAWNDSLVDSDGNGVFEFADRTMPLPVQRWTRELNFLGWVPAQGTDRVADLPAGAKLRVAVQWTEAHDPQADMINGGDLYRAPVADVRLLVLRQRDPSGSKVASDDFNVVARSPKLPQMIARTASLATYEHIVEFTVETAGQYAVRLEGSAPMTTRPAEAPALPAQNRRWESRARVFVEASGATNGRPVFADFATSFGGLGMPGDAMAPRTIGAANVLGEPQPYSAAGPSAGRDLLVKPTFLAFDELPLPGGVESGGTGCAAGFAGGIAACLLSAGAPADHSLRWLGLPPGGLLVVPRAWVDQLRQRTPTPRP